MKKELNNKNEKIEENEMNEEAKAEELTEEMLDTVDGGKFGDANEVLCNVGIGIGVIGAFTGFVPAIFVGAAIGAIGL